MNWIKIPDLSKCNVCCDPCGVGSSSVINSLRGAKERKRIGFKFGSSYHGVLMIVYNLAFPFFGGRIIKKK